MATVGSILEGAFGLVRRRPGAVAIWGLTYIVGSVAIMGVMVLLLGSASGFAPQPGAEFSSGMAGGFFGTLILFYVLYALLSVVLINAVYRAILRPNDTAFASLRVGSDEFRMLGLTILFVIGMIILYFISALAMMMIGGGLGLAVGRSPGVAVLVSVLLMLGFLGFWIWLSVRVSLIFPMTFHRRRFAIDEGWALGRGRFWTMFGAYLVVWIVIIAVSLIFFWSIFGALFAMIGSGGDPVAQRVAVEQMMESRAAAGIASMIFTMVGGAVLALLSFVLGYGVVGSAARELLSERGDVTEEEAEYTAQIFE